MLKYYFKRLNGSVIPKAQLYSYVAFVGGLVSLAFFFLSDSPRDITHAKIFLGVCMGISAICSAICLYKEAKDNSSCNVYDLLRCIVSGILCIMSFTCIDILLK